MINSRKRSFETHRTCLERIGEERRKSERSHQSTQREHFESSYKKAKNNLNAFIDKQNNALKASTEKQKSDLKALTKELKQKAELNTNELHVDNTYCTVQTHMGFL